MLQQEGERRVAPWAMMMRECGRACFRYATAHDYFWFGTVDGSMDSSMYSRHGTQASRCKCRDLCMARRLPSLSGAPSTAKS